MKKMRNRLPRIGIALLILLLGAALVYFIIAATGTGTDEGTEPSATPTFSPGGNPAQSQSSAEALVSAEDFKVIAYYPTWAENGLSKLRLDIITHIIYAFAIPTNDGTLRPLENPELARELIATAHEQGREILLAIGGWSYYDIPLESTFDLATNTPEKIASLAEDILTMCDEYGFDGVDMDWEYPRLDDGSYRQYEDLMKILEKELHAKGKYLTAAVISGVANDGSVYYDAAAQTDTVLAMVDWIHVMAYDGGDGKLHSGYEFTVNCMEYWKSTRGLAADKVVLGMPFYGRPGWISYENILAVAPDAHNSDTSKVNGSNIWYNGQDTIADKTNYALQNLGGVMIWEITLDAADMEKSLLTTIQETLMAQEAQVAAPFSFIGRIFL